MDVHGEGIQHRGNTRNKATKLKREGYVREGEEVSSVIKGPLGRQAGGRLVKAR